MYILFAILIFGFLIFIHELGHFMTAKLLGVQVNEFSICMGPALLQRTRGETTYSLRLIPIGGYCAMEGEDEDSDNPRAFTRAKTWRRLIILAAGAFMNFLAAFSSCSSCSARPTAFRRRSSPIFTTAAPWNPRTACRPGMNSIRSTASASISTPTSPCSLPGTRRANLTWSSARDGQTVKLSQFPMEKQTFTVDGQEVELYGMQFATEKKTAGGLLKMAWNNSLYFVQLVKLGLHDLVTGAVGLKDMSGPVGIVKIISDTGNAAKSVSDGVSNVLYLGAFIAINPGGHESAAPSGAGRRPHRLSAADGYY